MKASKATTLVVLLFALLALARARAEEAAWCAKPIGAAVSEYYSTRSYAVLGRIAELTGKGRTILYLTSALTDDADGIKAHLPTQFEALPEARKLLSEATSAGGMTEKQALEYLSDLAMEDFGTGPMRYVYINSNSPSFPELTQIEGTSRRGASLQMDLEAYRALQDSTSPYGSRIRKLLAGLKADVVVADGIDLGPAVVEELGGRYR